MSAQGEQEARNKIGRELVERLKVLPSFADPREAKIWEALIDAESRLAAAEAELAKCGKENCMGHEVEGCRSWVAKEAWEREKARAQAAEARLAEIEKERSGQ